MKLLTGTVRVGVLVALAGLAAGLLLWVAAAGAIDAGGALDGFNVMVDGERLDTSWLTLGAGGAAVFGILVASSIVMAVLVGLALVLPLILAGVLMIAAAAIVCGLIAALFGVAMGAAPLVVPVLLVLGLYALLRRRAVRPQALQ